MLFGALVHSPVSHGRVSCALHEADKSQCLLIDKDSILGQNAMRAGDVDIPIFCTGDVRYKGEPLAMVVADSAEKARKASSRCVISLLDSIEAGQQRNKETQHNAHNTVVSKRVAKGAFDGGDGEEVFRTADRVVRSARHLFPPSMAQAGETLGALCVFEDDALTVLTLSSSPARLKKELRRVLGRETDVAVQMTNKRGHEGEDYRAELIALQTSVAAACARASVKVMLSRGENEMYALNGVTLDIKHEAAIKDGRISALKIDIQADIGAYNPHSQELIAHVIDRCTGLCGSWNASPVSVPGAESPKLWSHILATEVSKLYEVDNVLINARALTASRPPTAASYREVDSMAFRATESLMCAISASSDTGERHFMLCGTDGNVRHNGIEEVIKKVVKMSDYSRKAVSFGNYRVSISRKLLDNNRISSSIREVRQNIGFAVDTCEGGDAICAVLETQRQSIMGGEKITALYLGIERSKERADINMEESVRVAVEKDISAFMGIPLDKEVYIVFVDRKDSDVPNAKKASEMISISDRVHEIIPAVIDAARRQD